MRPVSRRCPACGTAYEDAVFFCGHDGKITVQEQDPGDVDSRLGTQLGEYLVVARVADGAMGRVYEGRHPETKARVAIKVLHEDVAKDNIAVERFKREFETAQELEHDNIVKVLEFGETRDGSWFMTMEYLQGEELSGLIRRDGPQRPDRVIRIIAQVSSSLAHAHSYGVIHRDLKPDNVFLCESDDGEVVKILDFGSVKLQMETGPKLTAFGTTLGSPYYMSPEQAMGKLDVDQRTDVFAIAAIMHEMVTGKVCFEGSNVAEILMKIVNHDPAPASANNPAFPPSFDDVVDKGIKKDKTQRYAGTPELAQAMIASFGLEGDMDQWADTPQADIARALSLTTPPAPAVYEAPVVPVVPVSPMAAAPSTLAAGAGVNKGLLIGVAVGAVLLFGALVAVGAMLITSG